MTNQAGSAACWYLARHMTDGKRRELLFAWLYEQQVQPWTPLIRKVIPRADRMRGTRSRLSQVFPGYFFLEADLTVQSASMLRRHSAFLDFVSFGAGPCAVSNAVVNGLMSLYPDNAPEPVVSAPSPLTPAQYQHLLCLENYAHPVTRISMLLDLVRQA